MSQFHANKKQATLQIPDLTAEEELLSFELLPIILKIFILGRSKFLHVRKYSLYRSLSNNNVNNSINIL